MLKALDGFGTSVDEEKGMIALATGDRLEDILGEVDGRLGEIQRIRVVGCQPVAGGGVVTVACVVKDEQADRRDPLLHPARRLALVVPHGQQHRHDVAGGDLRHRQLPDAGVCVGFETRPPLRPRLRTAPGGLVRMAITASAAAANVGASTALPFACRGSPPALAVFQRSKAAARASAKPIEG